MARFYGVVQGGRGAASRLGHGTTGLNVCAKSYSGDVGVELYDNNGNDHVTITVAPHGERGRTLYTGTLQALMVMAILADQ